MSPPLDPLDGPVDIDEVALIITSPDGEEAESFSPPTEDVAAPVSAAGAKVSPAELSRQLREEDDPDLKRRRWVVGLSLFGAGLGQVVSLYQTGIIKRLPDPPFRVFDSEKVDASNYAYKRMQTPDALFMVASYAVTAILAGAGQRDRAKVSPALPIALAAKTILDTAFNIKLAREEWSENKALCAYCQAATVASAVFVALALPEAIKAIKGLRAPAETALTGDYGAGW